ncbi:MAG: hypothetical protein NC401_19700 [Ruminococcus sp.]|nr:hypothetical protein [Ruminococcus sp.]
MAKNEPLVWLTIDGKAAPQPRYPNGYTPVYSDFDSGNSKRNEAAVLRRQCIRKNVVSPKFSWRIQTKALHDLLNMISPERLNVKIYDPMLMDFREFTGYAQATRQPTLVAAGETYADCWWDFECSFIEY